MRLLKKIITWVFFLLGVVLIGFSAYNFIKVKFEQRFIATHTVSFVEQDTVSFNGLVFDYTVEPEFLAKSKLIALEKKDPFKRENYESGMMLINIPKIGVKAAVVKGTTEPYLKLGPGLYEKSVLPDKVDGNVCIAGHRTTYGAWFRRVDSLGKDDEITLDFNGTRYSYKVEKVFIVAKNDWSVTNDTGYSALTITACHPPGSDRQRIVVRGRLDEESKQ